MNDDQAPCAPLVEIAGTIHQTRVSRDWTQAELAARAGVSRPTVARIDSGKAVSIATLEKVAAALGLRVELA